MSDNRQVQSGPARVSRLSRPQRETRAKSALRQAVWEATQYLSYDEVRAYVEGVLHEVKSDEP